MVIGADKPARGFTLIEMAVVLLILGLLIGFGLQSTLVYLNTERRKTATARLAGVDAAIANFVAQQRRLPCPADGATASGAAAAGVEQRIAANGTCVAGAITRGVVPWVTLGLAEADAQDGWSNRLTYRTVTATVGAGNVGLTSNQALDMSNCDPSGAAARVSVTFAGQPVMSCVQNAVAVCDLATVAGCTSPTNYLANRGIRIEDGLGNILMNPANGTGAAYVLISHGEAASGAYNSAGIIQGGTPAPGPGEVQNRNNFALQPFYVDGIFNDGPVAHFDDMLSRPSLMSVITKAQTGPRAHLQ